jgi:hypothetical protein
MGKGPYSSQWLGSEVLHTNTKWITGSKSFGKLKLELENKIDLPSAIEACQNRERMVY